MERWLNGQAMGDKIEEGRTITSVAHEAGVAASTARRWLNEAGRKDRNLMQTITITITTEPGLKGLSQLGGISHHISDLAVSAEQHGVKVEVSYGTAAAPKATRAPRKPKVDAPAIAPVA
jgi:hypothetical protein